MTERELTDEEFSDLEKRFNIKVVKECKVSTNR